MAKKPTFKARKGARFSHKEAQKYGKRIWEIQQECGGEDLAVEVVNDARKHSSPLHNYFEWNRDVAARNHWIDQARYLIRHIEIEIEIDDEKRTTRAWHVVNDDGKDAYADYFRVFTSKELKDQVLKKALAEINGWKGRYAQYKEFSHIFSAIEKTEQRVA